MASTGMLQAMARADLEALVRELGRRYPLHALDDLSARDPGWRAALDRAERELGELYQALAEADATWDRWRGAVVEVCRLWTRTEAHRMPGGRAATVQVLEDVA